MQGGGGEFRSADERRATRLHYPLDAGLLHTAAGSSLLSYRLCMYFQCTSRCIHVFLMCCGYFEIECCSGGGQRDARDVTDR